MSNLEDKLGITEKELASGKIALLIEDSKSEVEGIVHQGKKLVNPDRLKKAVEGFQAGKTEYKTEAKAPVIHIALGKLNQPTEELSANITTLLQVLGKTRVKKVTLSPTMGPSVKLDLSSL